VRYPVSWITQYVNGDHECLMVRVSQSVLDPLSAPAWDASKNRHIGQRNIHVMSAAEAAAKPTLAIGIGPLFGGAADVTVQRAGTGTMPWLYLVTMDRARIPGRAPPRVTSESPHPRPRVPPAQPRRHPGSARRRPDRGQPRVTQDNQQVGFHATDGNPGPGQGTSIGLSGHGQPEQRPIRRLHRGSAG
jgi:hypothetical protein